MTIADDTTAAKIYYTTDGSTPTAASTLYTAPINVAKSETINAIAIKDGVGDSSVGKRGLRHRRPARGDYTQSVSQLSATQAQISFTPTVAAAFVDIHYLVNGGAQQNVRMTNTAGVWTQVVSGLQTGSVVTYWFTYEKSGPQYDTIHFTYTQGGSGGAVELPDVHTGGRDDRRRSR